MKMPVLIKDYTWRQINDKVIVRVPLRNIPHTKVDLFHSDVYIKVHFPPFLFECCLYEPIDEDESKCTLVRGEAVFELAKTEKKEWPSLHKDVSKQEMMQIKKEAIDHAQKRSEILRTRKREKIRVRRDGCIRQQLALDGKEREIIQDKKDHEKRTAINEILDWKENETDKNFLPSPVERATRIIKSLKGHGISTETKANEKKSVEHFTDSEDEEEDSNADIGKNDPEREKKSNAVNQKKDKEIWNLDELNEIGKPEKKEIKKPKVQDEVPPPRQYGSINVGFTYRAFPTPSRESTLNQEQEWLIKQKEARRKTGFLVEDLRPEENDPIWLLEKGKSFHDVGNYLGAISAFSHAISTWDKIPELYVARSSSQLCIGNVRRVIEDTCNALDLLKPHVDSNAEMRFQAHFNRGTALIELGKYEGAVADLVEALEIHPYREDVHHFIDRAEAAQAEMKNQPPEPPKGPGDVGKCPTEYIDPEVLAN